MHGRPNDSVNEIGVYAVAGDGNAVRLQKRHRDNPAVETESLCYIDGDSGQDENRDQGVFRLPGQMPKVQFSAMLREIWIDWPLCSQWRVTWNPQRRSVSRRPCGRPHSKTETPTRYLPISRVKLGSTQTIDKIRVRQSLAEDNKDEAVVVVERIKEVLAKAA
jgi:hypothetical protein